MSKNIFYKCTKQLCWRWGGKGADLSTFGNVKILYKCIALPQNCVPRGYALILETLFDLNNSNYIVIEQWIEGHNFSLLESNKQVETNKQVEENGMAPIVID